MQWAFEYRMLACIFCAINRMGLKYVCRIRNSVQDTNCGARSKLDPEITFIGNYNVVERFATILFYCLRFPCYVLWLPLGMFCLQCQHLKLCWWYIGRIRKHIMAATGETKPSASHYDPCFLFFHYSFHMNKNVCV